MSKRKKSKGRTTSPTVQTGQATAEPIRVVATPKASKRRPVAPTGVREPAETGPLVFGRDTYLWMGGGFLLVVIGFLLMTGGRGDDPTVFDESVIYSFRRITLAPIVILCGLGLTTYAIFKK